VVSNEVCGNRANDDEAKIASRGSPLYYLEGKEYAPNGGVEGGGNTAGCPAELIGLPASFGQQLVSRLLDRQVEVFKLDDFPQVVEQEELQ